MKNWLSALFSKQPNHPPAVSTSEGVNTPEDSHQVANQLQAFRIENEEQRRTIENLKVEIERLRSRQEQMLDLSVSNRLEALYTDLAAPASQIITQADLLETQGKPVQARDILSVARRMVRALERNGVVITYHPGETVSFDPGLHKALQVDQRIETGCPVRVRFAGVSYRGKMIYKALVEQEQACRED